MGHSLGGMFLVKYLAENIFPRKNTALGPSAAPFNAAGGEEVLIDFAMPRARTVLFDDKQHFNQETFLELADLIKNMLPRHRRF